MRFFNFRTTSCLFLVLFFSTSSWAESYTVTKVSDSASRAIVKGNTTKLAVGDNLALRDEFDQICNAKVVKVEPKQAVLDIVLCTNARAVKPGMDFHDDLKQDAPMRPASDMEEVSTARGRGPTADESWYTLWGFGFSSVNYSEKVIDDLFDYYDSVPGVDRFTTNVDLLGFYWPAADRVSMHGFIINGISDTLEDDDDERVSLRQYLYAYSYHRFFGANIGDGWFIRGDIGLNIFSVEARSSDDTYDSDRSDAGFGLMFGGGYAWPIGAETRMLLGAYGSHRQAEDFKANSFNLTLGFLF